MAATAMTIIEPAGIGQTEPLHGLRQVGKFCSQQKVVMLCEVKYYVKLKYFHL